MENKTILEITKLAKKIDANLNLFEGYNPKNIAGKKDEILFWREIVTAYGIFCDIDRVQIKENKNLFTLFVKFNLITIKEKQFVLTFYREISYFRSWFCHNNNSELYYVTRKADNIKNILNEVIKVEYEINSPEEVREKDWDKLCSYIKMKFSKYLGILKKALDGWMNKKNEGITEIDKEWYKIYSNALFNDNELKQNILAEMCKYENINWGRKADYNIGTGIKLYEGTLLEKKYSSENIITYLENGKKMTSYAIMYHVLEKLIST